MVTFCHAQGIEAGAGCRRWQGAEELPVGAEELPVGAEELWGGVDAVAGYRGALGCDFLARGGIPGCDFLPAEVF